MSDRIENALAAMSRARIRELDGSYLVRADRVQVGDLLDLEGDSIADPGNDGLEHHGTDFNDGNPIYRAFEFELAEVEAVEVETIGDETAIVIHTSLGSYGFPPDYEIEISLDRTAPPLFYLCGGCGHRHPVGWTGDCRDDAFRFTDEELDDELGPIGVGWEESTEDGRDLDLRRGGQE